MGGYRLDAYRQVIGTRYQSLSAEQNCIRRANNSGNPQADTNDDTTSCNIQTCNLMFFERTATRVNRRLGGWPFLPYPATKRRRILLHVRNSATPAGNRAVRAWRHTASAACKGLPQCPQGVRASWFAPTGGAVPNGRYPEAAAPARVAAWSGGRGSSAKRTPEGLPQWR